jgi:hypothetical protein
LRPPPRLLTGLCARLGAFLLALLALAFALLLVSLAGLGALPLTGEALALALLLAFLGLLARSTGRQGA